jgi:hypothetical protein
LSKCFCQAGGGGKEGERFAGRRDEMGEAKKRVIRKSYDEV